jgi:hypothetical protein
MSRQIQIRRGTTTQHSEFTGALGEITVDTDKKTICVHDGATAGGIALARADAVQDFDLPENMDYVIETQAPTSANNYTWYRKYNSGWIEQGGIQNSVAISTGTSITFPITMQDTNYYSNAIGISASVAYGYGIKNLSATGMTLLHSATGGAINMAWEIKGYMDS